MGDMSTEHATAVADPSVEEAPPKEETSRRKPKRLPPYAVVVLNDDLHTFAYVIETFIKVFGYAPEKCFQLAQTIHTQGRRNVETDGSVVGTTPVKIIIQPAALSVMVPRQ